MSSEFTTLEVVKPGKEELGRGGEIMEHEE